MAAAKPDLTRFAAQPGPAVGVRLGYAGLPLLLGGALSHLCGDTSCSAALRRADSPRAAIYGAVILSFLGGVRWGIAMAGRPRGMREFVLSVLPSPLGRAAAGLLLGRVA